MLPIRVADPGGGPPWGMRLVRTNRGDTCVQVGRVEHGEIGSLGIDYSWGNDHKFHPIKPNDGVFDICGATDAAGHGFVSSSMHGWPASAFNPSDYGSGTAASYCQSASRRAAKPRVHPCPTGSLRMIFVGLLGPDAKSITYKTPSGATKTEDTVGGVGAYLIVSSKPQADCETLLGAGNDCAANYAGTDNAALRPPNAVTSVTYDNGKTCTIPTRSPSTAIIPQCPPVGWVAAKEPKLTNAQLASPISFTVVEAKQYCYNTRPADCPTRSVIGCDNGVPKGYHRSYLTPPGKKALPLRPSHLQLHRPSTREHHQQLVRVADHRTPAVEANGNRTHDQHPSRPASDVLEFRTGEPARHLPRGRYLHAERRPQRARWLRSRPSDRRSLPLQTRADSRPATRWKRTCRRPLP